MATNVWCYITTNYLQRKRTRYIEVKVFCEYCKRCKGLMCFTYHTVSETNRSGESTTARHFTVNGVGSHRVPPL